MGRPRAKINQEEFEKLCSLQCTKLEICAWFNVTDKTLEAWCKRTYKKGFSEIFSEKRGIGKISLRRAQFQLAKKNAAMAIFLGKNWLCQSDSVKIEGNKDGKLADLIDGLREDDDLHEETTGADAPVANKPAEAD